MLDQRIVDDAGYPQRNPPRRWLVTDAATFQAPRARRVGFCERHRQCAYGPKMNTQTRTSGLDAAPLGLGSVLVDSLPAALLTDDTPDRYTVEAVFTRRPSREEIAAILSGPTRDRLGLAGYPTAELTVSDRRLEIANTNLGELTAGLATVLADLLADISATVRSEQDAAAARSRELIATEQARAAAVATLARSVTFTPTHAAPAAVFGPAVSAAR